MNPVPFTLLRLLSGLYLVFVIYGSLVPLEFRYIPLEQAVERFEQIRFLNLGIGSRADWVANLLLFIPAAFLLTGAFWHQKTPVNVIRSLVILAFCLILTLGIEFTQLYFPQRTVSQNDIFAEIVGSVLGIVAWWLWGLQSSLFYQGWHQARGATQLSEKLLWIYLAILIAYNILPLDLTISPVEIYHKWQSGKVNLIPFGFYHADLAQLAYALLTDMIIWVPVSLLLSLSGKTAMQAFRKTLLIALILEFLQFFVYSRVTDITDLLTAAMGAASGLYLGRFFKTETSKTSTRKSLNNSSGLVAIQSAMLFFWLIILVTIFWYPFEFTLERNFLRENVANFMQTPLRAYYYGTEFRAITEVFHKIGFFIPLGALVGWARQTSLSQVQSHWLDRLIILALFIPGLGIEFGQLAIDGKSAQITDAVLEWTGCIIGFSGFLFIAKRWHLPAIASQETSTPPDTHIGSADITPEGTTRRQHNPRFVSFPLSLMGIVWLMVLLTAPDLSPQLHADSSKSLDFLATWNNGNDILLTWPAFVSSFLLFASMTREPPKQRQIINISLWTILALCWIAATWIFDDLSLTSQIAAITLALASAHYLHRPLRKLRSLKTTNFLVILLPIVALIPASLNLPLIDGIGQDGMALGERLYFLIKSLILWVPLGLIASINEKQHLVERWGQASFWSFILVCLPFLPQAPLTALMNLLAIPAGIYAGIWLANSLAPQHTKVTFP